MAVSIAIDVTQFDLICNLTDQQVRCGKIISLINSLIFTQCYICSEEKIICYQLELVNNLLLFFD